MSLVEASAGPERTPNGPTGLRLRISGMDYDLAKGLQALLFFGVALGFPIWQLISVRRDLRKNPVGDDDKTRSSGESG